MTDDLTLYRRVYDLIGEHAPLLGDCGELCGAACCGGSGKDGMLVFPGEEALLRRVRHPLLGLRLQEFRLKPADLRGHPCHFAVCRRGCLHAFGGPIREARPLSCRIFPYAPVLREGKVEVIPDPRAKRLCPLAHDPAAHPEADPDFPGAVQAAFTLLLKERPGMAEFLTAYTEMLEDYQKFLG